MQSEKEKKIYTLDQPPRSVRFGYINVMKTISDIFVIKDNNITECAVEILTSSKILNALIK